ncbi:glutaredoxin 3 [Rhodospirillum rubrum]|uniref:Glutaredoxin n=1 Tax=Rhodospirillum rubrum (strain ATCC 11170 / ATH 1.1.1 / DSM 467 / LMG 4362 / NCIMB 8255 / S1) TaxID=269796 RepID=Q2RWF3_RHORT|nr:glutaredoxin 3 [Rhodospirillum rubrum]ABC21542.1 Glutaredoxin, GrxC [Rhodospirillum rubrum ATCC 11170]AEO47227.1 glutaredoxin GrxC [Rhodospirillum rubrum F11]MBK5953164.1 glutaredoxin 3 [Rhodospirillum rubrum]QXG81214.1 glutaredoxin 3 [Rhodospirillum rubrum]HAQ01263.1 glutaredoxin 3 [Rhodospirillum rubrum]
MVAVEIFTTPSCPYCRRAKALLGDKGVAYREIDVSGDPRLREEMTRRAGGRSTVPQIFIDGRALGGCDDIHALDRLGKLDGLLSGSAP